MVIDKLDYLDRVSEQIKFELFECSYSKMRKSMATFRGCNVLSLSISSRLLFIDRRPNCTFCDPMWNL